MGIAVHGRGDCFFGTGRADEGDIFSDVSFGALQARWSHTVILTSNAHPIAILQGIPHHGSIGNGEESLWVLIWVGRKCGEA